MSKRSRRDRFELMRRDDPSEQRRDITVRSYAVRASTLNEQARTIDAVMATEQPVQVFDMRTWSVIREILVIDGGTFPEQVPLLDSHDRSSIKKQLGSTRNIRAEKGAPNQMVGTRHLSSVPDASEAFTKMREGHLRDGSIGYRVTGFQDLQPGESATIKGRTFKNDGSDTLRISHEWRVMEDSLTPIGADDLAKTRNAPPTTADRADPTKEPTMNLEALCAQFGEKHRSLLAKALADGKNIAAITSMVVAAERAEAETAVRGTAVTPANGGTQPTAPPVVVTPAPSESERAAGMVAERQRALAIRTAAGNDIPAEMVDTAINDGWDLARTNREFLAHMRASRGQGAAITAGVTDRSDAQQRALEAALAMRAGVMPVVERRGQRIEQLRSFRMPDGRRVDDTQAVAAAEQFRSIGLQDLARLCLRMRGEEAPINATEFYERSVSTLSLPNILGNVLRRTLENSYEEAPSTILEWASPDELPDFRQSSHLRLGKFGRPNTPGDGGEFDYQSLTEAKETQQLDTSGIWFGITRKQFINDDLRAFTRVAPELGMAMRRNVDDLGYEVLVQASGVGPTMNEDSKAMFATDHSDGANYYINAAAPLSAASLSTLKQQMRKIKQGAVFLNLLPVVLLVPPELEHTARQLVQSSTLAGGTTTTNALLGNANPHFGGLKIVVEPRLSAATNGTTAWYLVCAPGQAKSLVVSTLIGAPGPSIERRDPQRTLGLGWIAYHDVGVDAVDFRGIQRSKGAA